MVKYSSSSAGGEHICHTCLERGCLLADSSSLVGRSNIYENIQLETSLLLSMYVCKLLVAGV